MKSTKLIKITPLKILKINKVNTIKFSILLILILSIIGCQNDDNALNTPDVVDNTDSAKKGFSVNENYILNDGIPMNIKGVVYVPGYPGFLPWEIEQQTALPQKLRESIDRDISNIKAMGANTVRFWGAPKYCYTSIKNIGDLYFLQTIWIDGEYPDFQEPSFKASTKSYIRSVIDRIYSVYNNEKPPLIAILIGNELSKQSILETDAAHPEITKYEGEFIRTSENVTASEAFIAEMADYVKSYEFDTYGNLSLVSYSNDIRTIDYFDTPFLDFRCHNAYSYAVPYYKPTTSPGSTSGTLFQGYIEEVKSMYPEMPLLITETGLSVSPNAANVGAPNYGYGGNTEVEQADGLLQNLSDIKTASNAITGVCIHEYLDAWWKFSLEDSYSQDPDDIEEWFGLVKLVPSGQWYETDNRSSYSSIKNQWTE